jgi:hypothetical protein
LARERDDCLRAGCWYDEVQSGAAVLVIAPWRDRLRAPVREMSTQLGGRREDPGDVVDNPGRGALFRFDCQRRWRCGLGSVSVPLMRGVLPDRERELAEIGGMVFKIITPSQTPCVYPPWSASACPYPGRVSLDATREVTLTHRKRQKPRPPG